MTLTVILCGVKVFDTKVVSTKLPHHQFYTVLSVYRVSKMYYTTSLRTRVLHG
ncbi:hypothetical protein HanPSC8_Chr17g0764041 [Helianthus annuus]|nr:hypothetical protein HanPSC8_Chr17g0764041 [Helianthus annuus]